MVPTDYDLQFTEKSTGKKVFVKRIVEGKLRILDPETGLVADISKHKLYRDYKSSIENKKLRSRKPIAAKKLRNSKRVAA